MSATQDIAGFKATLAEIEAGMIDASADPDRFRQLEKRRAAIKAELTRLQYAEQREAKEAEVAHRQALHDRNVECADDARRIREAGAALEEQIMNMLDTLRGFLAEAAVLMREHRLIEGRSLAVQQQLRALGEKPLRAGVGTWRCPSEATALAVWENAHAVMHSGGIRVDGIGAISASQRAAARR